MPNDESNEKLSKEFDEVLKASLQNQPKDDNMREK